MTVSKIRLPDNTEHDIRAKYLIQSTSADAVSAEFSARTVTEDAIANIQKIYGNTYKFLQAAQGETASNLVTQDTSVTTEHKYISNSTTTSSTRAVYFNGSTIPDGHVTLIVGILKSDYTNAPYYRIRRGSGSYMSINLTGYQQNTWITTIQRDTAGFMGGSNSGIMVNGNNYTQGKYISLPNDGGFAAYDLTYMFGAGSEPSTDDFLALFSAVVYPYNAGSLLSNKTVSIQSKDSGDNIIGNCDLNIPTLTGKLNGTGSSVVIFPNGMGYDGVNRDELTGQKAIRKTKIVDMGTLTWTYSSYYTAFYCSSLPSDFKQAGSNTHIRSGRYTLLASTASDPRTDADKTIKGYNGYLGYYLVIKDTSYTSAELLKTSLSGVNLCYEVASPQEYTLDNALQLQYPVVAGGTEMVLPTSGTAPMKMDVIYGNAADAAATMPQNFISVDSMKEFLAALGTQMGGTWSMGYENGKHTFTFTSN